MNTFIGIDLGTSAAKLLLVTADGRILSSECASYPVRYPADGWSEQDPVDWFDGVIAAAKRLLKGQDKASVRGIGLGGQMHGLVALDKYGKVIRPCILWNDGRTEKETAYLNEHIGKDKLLEMTGNIAFAGFTAPKILWLKKHEPKNFEKIDKILLPKDYIVYRLTGEFSSDYSDFAGTLLLDVEHKRFSEEMCEICGVNKQWLPTLHESYETVGTLVKDIADELGLKSDVIVCAGAGDNAAAAVGTGIIRDGDCNVSLGTSGTVFIPRDKFDGGSGDSLHNFCHASGKYHLMGCILSAASCNRWWMEEVLKSSDFDGEQRGAESMLGKNGVYFLPYLMGERSPHNDVNARGAFIGLRPDTSRTAMTLAVLEGVAFALKDCGEAAKKGGANIESTRICGGGAKSPLWRKIIADVLGVPVEIPKVEEGPAYGGAILAMTAYGAYPSLEAAVSATTSVKETVLPDKRIVEHYKHRYEVYKELYPALKGVFAKM